MASRKGIPNKKVFKPKTNLKGKIFGYLKVLKYETGGWNCKCDCGKIVKLKTRRLTHDKVKSCGCKRIKKGNVSHRWKGFGNLSASIVTHCINHAISRGIEFSVDIEYLWNLFQKQKGKCALSGISLVLGNNYNDKNRTASIDRIDSDVGYIEGNVQWIHKRINKIKMDLKQPEFIYWCSKVHLHSFRV